MCRFIIYWCGYVGFIDIFAENIVKNQGLYADEWSIKNRYAFEATQKHNANNTL